MSVQELLAPHDCAVPGCPDEARERGGKCRYHAANPGPSPVAAGSHAHLMEESPPVNTCKVDGCPNPSARKGGWTSGLCQAHISEGMQQRQATAKARRSAAETRGSDSASSSEAKKPEARAASPQPRPPRTRPAARREPSAPAAPNTLVDLAQTVEDTRRAAADALTAHYAAKDALLTAVAEMDAVA